MGFAKQRLIELEERGFGEVPDKYVCVNCFANQGIKNFIKKNAVSHICSYCGREDKINPIAASLEDVIGLLVRSIRRLYDDPANFLPWDSEDKRYVGITYSLDDVLQDMGLELALHDKTMSDQLYNDLTTHIYCNLWAERGVLSKSEAYQAGWTRFTKQVKHYSRYTFALIKYKLDPHDACNVPLPSQILPLILELINKSQLRRVMKKKEVIYRARIVSKGEEVNNCAKDLGPPRNENALFSNRMSPAGIPMFYGALDRDTALQEIRAVKYTGKDRGNFSLIKIAKFVLLKDITVVDFSRHQEYCLFDENISDIELNIKAFLNHFAREISKPIEKDGREHIEYVPTQIVAEYLKYKCRSLNSKRKRIKGILYKSSRGPGVSCALFFRNNHCVDKGDTNKKAFLKLIDVETIDW